MESFDPVSTLSESYPEAAEVVLQFDNKRSALYFRLEEIIASPQAMKETVMYLPNQVVSVSDAFLDTSIAVMSSIEDDNLAKHFIERIWVADCSERSERFAQTLVGVSLANQEKHEITKLVDGTFSFIEELETKGEEFQVQYFNHLDHDVGVILRSIGGILVDEELNRIGLAESGQYVAENSINRLRAVGEANSRAILNHLRIENWNE